MSTSSTSSLREEILDLMIDLRPHLPTSAYPNIPKLTTIFTQTLSSGAFPRHRVAILPGDRKGKYLLRLLDRSLYQKLIGRSITITPPKMRGRRNTDIKVFIDAYKPEQNSRSKVKEVTVLGTFDEELIFVTDAEWDYYFSQYGEIKKRTEAISINGIFTGERVLELELSKDHHIEKSVEVKIYEMDDEGRETETLKASGKIRVKYRGQPYYCKKCATRHTFCEKGKQEREYLENVKRDREPKVNQLILGTSNLRHINETSLAADVICSPGARYGHLANQLATEDLEQYDTVTIVGGCNNFKPSAPTTLEHDANSNAWISQLESEILCLEKTVGLVIDEGKEVIISKPLDLPLAKINENTIAQRELMDIALINMRNRIDAEKGPNKIFLLTPPQHDEIADFEQDKQHLTTAGTAKLLDHYNEVLETIPKQVGDKVRSNLILRNGQQTTAQRRHERVTTAYPFGCKKCCEIGHGAARCPHVEYVNTRAENERKRPREASTSPPQQRKQPRDQSPRQ